ncbi:YtxH domain-containing protein [Candidatus Cardinium hertigii]|uniref:YtxH domain-containing protein n=1 Tax=Candidatus Cardinium hertigii TaxID=247481 RepID=A0A2Z3LBW2_9BACT|nr:YtxH domain-containing protein [Candidatus Cardinium hertigii]AWN81426.1 hypothetical protein DK880_00088 [Candidatus Cardinium hertigii]
MKWNLKSFCMLFVVLCLGILVGILAAPETGSVVRSGLMYNLKSYRKKLKALVRQLIGNKYANTNQAKSMGEEVITDVIQGAEKILKELSVLTDQLR